MPRTYSNHAQHGSMEHVPKDSSVEGDAYDGSPRDAALSNYDNETSMPIYADADEGFWHGLKRHPHAVAWSICLSTAVIMEGFDILLIQSLLAVDSFKRQFGEQLFDGSYEVSAAWQAGLTNGAIVGEVLGLMLNGIIADRYGFRKTMIGALSVTVAFIFIPFFATNVVQLLVGLILMGIPWGVFQTLTTTYAAEIVPTSLRPYLTTYVNICWVIGQLLASAVLVGVQDRDDQWAYRIPYALQWIWPLPLIVAVIFAPESPWWLVRKGRVEDAKNILRRLRQKDDSDSLDAVTSMMIQTNEFEQTINEGTSYLDCFKGVDLRRTEITCNTWLVQTMAGSTFMGYSTYFYQSAGLGDNSAFSLSLGQYAIGGVGVIISWVLMSKFGRRFLFLSGLALMAMLFLIIGCCGLASQSNSSAQWAIGSMLLIYTFIYDCTVGPLAYAIVAEIPSTRLRQKTVVLARNTYNVGAIVCNVLITRQLNPGAWNWGAKAGFFWAGSCLLCFLWAYFRLPEPKGRSFVELDMLFEKRTPARLFRKTNIELQDFADRTCQKTIEAEPEHLEHSDNA